MKPPVDDEAASARQLAEILNAPQPVHNPGGHLLSKSRFVAGVQCLKRLWLRKHQPHLGFVSDAQQQRMNQGTAVGILARELYPNGKLIEADRSHLAEALLETQRAIADGASAIFEATFQHSGVLVRVDILERLRQRFRLTEVKSATRLKDHFAYDVGIQRYVLAGAGLSTAETRVLTLNPEYEYDGEKHDPSRLFVSHPVTPIGARELTRHLSDQFTALSRQEPPEVTVNGQCSNPTECEFYCHCHPELPPDDIRSVLGYAAAEPFVCEGIVNVRDIPDRSLARLTAAQRTKVHAVRSGETWFNREAWGRSTATLQYPICFMDFETVYPALPKFKGMRPYEHIPFQWSVHRQEHATTTLTHRGFLAETSSDPRRQFIEQLISAVRGARTIVVYNAGFESQILNRLAACMPEHQPAVDEMRDRLWDLLPVVRRCVYAPAFGASYSLKSVLPALVPDLSYENLDVADGTDAGVAWSRLLEPTCGDREKEDLKKALLAYCGQDTLALHRLVQTLDQMAADAE